MAERRASRPPRRRAVALGTALDHPWYLILGAVAVAFAVWAIGTRQEPHHVRVAFPAATQLVKGLDVQLAGTDAGKVTDIRYRDGKAVVELGIDDDAWPLPAGTTAAIRYGATIATGARRIDLTLGRAGGGTVPDGGILHPTPGEPLVEFDEVFNTFDPATRAHMQRMLARTATALAGHEPALNAGLRRTPQALVATGGLLDDLGHDEQAIDGLLVNGHRATRILAAQRQNITDLVDVGGATFDAFARRSAQIRASLDEFPQAMDDVRGALQRLGRSSTGLHALVRDLAPGAARLVPLARRARTALAELARTAPVGTAAIRTTVRAAPGITALLREGRPFSGRLAPVLSRLTPMLACIRPYAPEIAGFMSTWASYAKNHDATSHYARVHVTASATSNHLTPPDMTTADYMKLNPELTYAMPRPPGFNAGQAWLQPQCGTGADGLDPAKDPEDHR